MSQPISPQDLYQKLRSRDDLYLIDNRDTNQYSSWHIPGAVNIPTDTIVETFPKIPKIKEIVVICNRGHTSEFAAQILASAGYNVRKLDGGLKAWNSIYEIAKVEPKRKTKIKVFQVKRLGKGCLFYIIGLGKDNEIILVDPTRHINYYVESLQKFGLKPQAIIDTHVHADHVSGGRELAKHFKIPYLLPKKSKVDFYFEAIEEYLPKLFSPIKIDIIDTPGHTPESLVIIIDNVFMLTGDTLFIKSVGRSDLGQEKELNASLLYKNVKQKLFKLNDEIMVLAAHAEDLLSPGGRQVSADIKSIKKNNQIAKFSSLTAFVKYIKSLHIPTPPNYQIIKEVNKSGLISDEDLDELELGGNSCAVK